MSDLEQRAIDHVRRYIRYGLYTRREVEQIVGQDVFGGEISVQRLREMVEAEAARHTAEQASWPEVTDCDRLDAVFDSLTAGGIIALQNAGYTLSDGLDDVGQAYHEAGGERSHFTGFCFYHRQDLDGVLESGKLCLAFGAVSGDAAEGVEIGRRVAAALEASGFTVDWNGSLTMRIALHGIKWQRG